MDANDHPTGSRSYTHFETEAVMKQLYTQQEVADIFGVTPRTVRNWIAEGKLDALRCAGRSIRIEESSLWTLAEPVQTNQPNSKPRKKIVR
jgi:excisionase family DNA binding protein